MSENNSNNGCEQCDDFWQLSKVSRPEELKTNFARHGTLYQCPHCLKFWEESERFAVIISSDDVEKYYGNEFITKK